MKYIFLNHNACSGKALTKWRMIKDHLIVTENCKVIENREFIDWDHFDIKEGDSFLSAGGDGTLHCLVNDLIKHKGLDVLSKIKIGHIGLGSNNSYLRPYSECQILAGIPMKISAETFSQDLVEVQIENNGELILRYCVANASLGFLAHANKLFNNSSDIAILKRWNSDLADVYTFFRALFQWKSLSIKSSLYSGAITNFHIMKRPFYASDLCFPENIQASSGKFRINLLKDHSTLSILKRFIKMLIFKKFEEGRDFTSESDELIVSCDRSTAMELDGEIVYGTAFHMTALKGKINLCK